MEAREQQQQQQQQQPQLRHVLQPAVAQEADDQH
jgi:hypothetical protein